MNRRFSFLAMAAVAALALSAPAHAGNVMVYADSGGGSADIAGTSGGATLNSISYTTDVISEVNSLPINPTLSLILSSLTITKGVTIGGIGTISDGSGVKVISTTYGSTPATTLMFDGITGTYTQHFLNLSGTIETVTGSTPGYDFHPLVLGTIDLTFSDSASSFSFFKIIGHTGPGSSQLGIGFGLDQTASVPEPGSIALLGIGMTGLLAIRRLFKRAKA